MTLLLGLGFCGGSDPPAVTPSAPSVVSLAPLSDRARLYYDDSGGFRDSVRLVIRERDRWLDAWERATERRAEPPPLPSMDFGREMVLLVAAGRMRPGDRIRVDSVGVRQRRSVDGPGEEVFEAVIRTVEGCGPLQTAVYPLELVRVPRFDGPVIFQEVTERDARCDQ